MVPTGNERKPELNKGEVILNSSSHPPLLCPRPSRFWLYSLYPFGSEEVLLNLELLIQIVILQDSDLSWFTISFKKHTHGWRRIAFYQMLAWRLLPRQWIKCVYVQEAPRRASRRECKKLIHINKIPFFNKS